jgi:hypothetical protein
MSAQGPAVGSARKGSTWLVGMLIAVALLAVPRAAVGQSQQYAIVIQGASGEEQYAALHRQWLDRLVAVLRDRFKYDAAHLVVHAEKPAANEQPSTADAVRGTFLKLTPLVKAQDQLFVMFIGHGSADAADAKFNLVGRDLTMAEWSTLLKPITGRVAVVDTTSASFPFLAGLSVPGRVVITATSSAGQRFHTVFPDGFVQAFTNDAADLDKNGRISLLEAFSFASRQVKQYYEQADSVVKEVAMVDDNGDGKGRNAAETGEDGTIAGLMYLDAVAVPTASDPETQRLLQRRLALTEQVDDLRRRRPAMAPADYDRQFEALIIELALVSRDVRRKMGGV